MSETKPKISRAEAAKRLGVTARMVGYLESSGRLTSHRIDGHVFYDEAEVESLRLTYRPDPQAKRNRGDGRSTSGTMAARVFACFQRGLSNVDEVVVQTGASPDLVVRLYEDFRLPLPDAVKRRKAEEAQRAKEKAEKEARREKRTRDFLRWKEKLAKIRASSPRG